MNPSDISQTAKKTFYRSAGITDGAKLQYVIQFGKRSLSLAGFTNDNELRSLLRIEVQEIVEPGQWKHMFAQAKGEQEEQGQGLEDIVKAQVLCEKYLLVPKDQYIQGKGKELYDLVYFRYPDEQLFKDELSLLSIINIYSLPFGVRAELEKTASSKELSHIMSNMLSALLHKYKNYDGVLTFAHLEERSLFITCLKDGALVFCNHFEINANEDLVYYLLGVGEQVGMDTKNDQLIFSGRVDEGGEVYEMARSYFRNISLITPPLGLRVPKEISQKGLHEFFPLLASIL